MLDNKELRVEQHPLIVEDLPHALKWSCQMLPSVSRIRSQRRFVWTKMTWSQSICNKACVLDEFYGVQYQILISIRIITINCNADQYHQTTCMSIHTQTGKWHRWKRRVTQQCMCPMCSASCMTHEAWTIICWCANIVYVSVGGRTSAKRNI